MKEQFDRKLVEKIRDSFLNHEEPFNPQEWEKLSHAYFHPRKKKKFAYWPFLISGIAASLLLVLVFWPIGDDLQKNVQTITDSISIENKQFEKAELPRQEESENLAQAEKNLGSRDANKAVLPASDSAEPDVVQREVSLPIQHVATVTDQSPSLEEMGRKLEQSMDMKQDIQENAANEKIGNLVIAQRDDTKTAQQWVDAWKGEVAGAGKSEQKESSNKMRLGLLVGPQTTSNAGEGMTLGAGIMSEFSINNRLKLDVGVTYASHSMVPERNDALPQSDLMSSLSARSSFIGSDSELNFSGLDIPINLKYKVMDKEKSGLYLISGLSSMVYLNQKTYETYAMNSYFTTSTEGALAFRQSVQEFTHEARPEGGADGMDLGRMLNLSVGYEYNLKNGTYLSIEPYYKLPLGDMTFANQQFSIGG
ncbi:MAG TPA: hypothetical protein VKZ51_09035, partial [Cyclobacteriaceae bacterium]|nr:hypothetical protein [Cyclobacteriaceae bacterium]